MMSFSRPSNCLPVPAACPWWLFFAMLVWLSYPLLTSSVHSCDGYLTPKMFSLFFKFKFCSFPFISAELMTCADCSVSQKGKQIWLGLCALSHPINKLDFWHSAVKGCCVCVFFFTFSILIKKQCDLNWRQFNFRSLPEVTFMLYNVHLQVELSNWA